jgi:hypothetical protein
MKERPMPSPRHPAPPVDSVSFEVLDIDWSEVPDELETMIEHPVEVEIGPLGDGEPMVSIGGVLTSVDWRGEDEELELSVEGHAGCVSISRRNFVRGEAAHGYVGMILRNEYLTISYFARVNSEHHRPGGP